MAQFLLSCESTVEYMHSRGIPVIFYSYIVDEQAYPDDMGRDPEALPRFYAFLDAGKLPGTRRNEHGENKKTGDRPRSETDRGGLLFACKAERLTLADQALNVVHRPLAEVLDQIELVADGESGVLVAERLELFLDGLGVHLEQLAGARQDLAAVDLLDRCPELGSVLLDANALNCLNAHTYSSLKILVLPAAQTAAEKQDCSYQQCSHSSTKPWDCQRGIQRNVHFPIFCGQYAQTGQQVAENSTNSGEKARARVLTLRR